MKTTESNSKYDLLELLSTEELLRGINHEDKTVPLAVEKCIPQLIALVDVVASKMQQGGRLFYLGAGTSGRLGIVDASECPPTYGIAHGRVVGIMAGGDGAMRKAVEFAEDDAMQGWNDLQAYTITDTDVVLGIAASGTTPYVIGALLQAQQHGITTACITCNAETPVSKAAHYPIECIVGPEYVTGSTRMKAGTAQKLLLNMLSTSVMIKLGHVKGNKMVDMQLTNNKLIERGARMVAEALNIEMDKAQALLLKHGSVRLAVQAGSL
ncbi:MAG: N-acetylmuramic acid 6-phosphate etherase [Bacteroidetes bacterium]|nr:N-acetylmuramic acid 6-phosphate etherase [Bacteroidota bacterium]